MFRLKFAYDLSTEDVDTAQAILSNIEESMSHYDGSFEEDGLTLELYSSDVEDEHGNSIYDNEEKPALAQGTWVDLSGTTATGQPWTMEVCLDKPICNLCDQQINESRPQGGWIIHSGSPVCAPCVEKHMAPDPDRPPVG